jgi:hypothetical protein
MVMASRNSRPRTGGPAGALIDWSAVWAEHGRWLCTVVSARAVTVQPAPSQAWVLSPHTTDFMAWQRAAPAIEPSKKPAEPAANSPAGSAPLDQVEKQLKSLTYELEQLRKVIEELRRSPAGQSAKPDGEQ